MIDPEGGRSGMDSSGVVTVRTWLRAAIKYYSVSAQGRNVGGRERTWRRECRSDIAR